MIRKAGITRKTFLFVALLIVAVTFVSFAILYFAMPPYYLYRKEQALGASVAQLKRDLTGSSDLETSGGYIREFIEANNATVAATGPEGIMILQLSTPFVSLNAGEEAVYNVYVNGQMLDADSSLTIVSDDDRQGREEMDRVDVTQGDAVRGDIAQGDKGQEDIAQGDKSAGVEDNYILLEYEMGPGLYFEEDIDNEFISRIQVQGTLQPIDEARGVILSLIPYALAAGTVIGAILAWFYVRQLTRPILKLSATAEQMQQMEPGVESGIRTNDELGLLSENMDALYQTLIQTIDDLKQQMDKVNRLEQSKTAMMQSASHELKTPVAALAGMLDGMIDNVGAYKDKDKYLRKCKGQVEKLSFLVKEILEASRSDGDVMGMAEADTEVDTMVEHILREQEYQIKERYLTIEKNLIPVVISTNPQYLHAVIVNLIGNAVLYTPQGGMVRICLNESWLEIENESEPIAKDELEQLFEPFYTRSASRDKAVSGTGLGLYIVRRNLERLSLDYEVGEEDGKFKIKVILGGTG